MVLLSACFSTCPTCCLQFHGLEHLAMTLAALLARGATWMLEHGFSLEAIRFAGFRASGKGMSSYLQGTEGVSALLNLTERGMSGSSARCINSLDWDDRLPPLSLQCAMELHHALDEFASAQVFAVWAQGV
jgi:hypothetical protein